MLPDLEKILNFINEKSKWKIREKDLEIVLAAIKKTDDFWEIIKISKLPVVAITNIIKVFEKEGIVKIENNENIKLTEQGIKLLDELGIDEYKNYSCQNCQGRGLIFDYDLELYQKFVEISKKRPEPLEKYDQGYVTPETTISRVLFMDSRGDLKNKDVLIIGAEMILWE